MSPVEFPPIGCPQCGGDFVTHHTNIADGSHLQVCMHCLADHLGNPSFVVRKNRRACRVSVASRHYVTAAWVAVGSAIAIIVSHLWR